MSTHEELKAELAAVTADRDAKADACRVMGDIITRQGQWAVEATSSEDVIGDDGDGDWEVVWDRVFDMRRERDRQANALQAIEEQCAYWDGLADGDKHYARRIREVVRKALR